ncbi:hypothetical protein Poli38472_002941 [Pythium oligandrum]|uniref:FYVE-type domain-containing protein n=1 Tax=Pythium oligandrum TaxID=41045 RepID=A0A8K1FCB6_PYTOL|nr:hypothetical protein Poli38472_002941 [Pythium oligandrum]|eukprot:TMW57016.1 hypothetical protein Poli38472_002941 [Pythium oligandrum]
MSSYSHSSSTPTSGLSSSATSGGHGGFPLRTNFFRSLPLTKETMEALSTSAQQNAAACLSQSFNEQWRYVPPEKDGTQLRKDTSNLASSFRLVRTATVLRCQEHEINMIISNTNTESWREFVRKCFGKHYVDTMILHSFHPPQDKTPEASENASSRGHQKTDEEQKERQTLWLTEPLDLEDEDGNQPRARRRNSDTQSVSSENNEEANGQPTPSAAAATAFTGNEQLTVKWIALDTGGQGKRDLCIMDYLSTAAIPNTENQEFVHSWCFSSVEGERVGCMALKDTHSITRTSLTKLGMFWRRLSEEETEVIVCGSFPSKHAKYVSTLLLQCLNRLQGIVEDLRLSNQIYIHRSTWVKDHERSSCHLCMRNFYALRRKHHCRKCGEVICSDCSVVENVDLPVIGYSKLRLCKVCCLKAKSTPLKRLEKSNVFDHLVRARSMSNLNIASPYPTNSSRMSFADTGSSNGSGSGSGGSHHHSRNHHTSVPHGNVAHGGEFHLESSTHSSASLSSINTNDLDFPDALDEFTAAHTANGSTAAAAVHPIPVATKDSRSYSNASATDSTLSPVPMLSHDQDFDDFIDARHLNKQLSAMAQKQKQKNGGRPTNSNMFDLLCELACQTLNCPIASVSILDSHGESIRSVTGLDNQTELDEELALFIEKVMGSTPTVVLDANVDKQVQSLFARRGAPRIRFFAGSPIYSRTGKKLGYVCVADLAKRDTLGPSCAFTMERLAWLAVTTMERNLAAKPEREHSPSPPPNNQAGNHSSNSANMFDRPVPPPRHRNNTMPAPMQARIYDLSDPELPEMVGSPVYVTPVTSTPMPPVAPMPRAYGDYQSGYQEAQERMRKLLIKSYHTQQQLASGNAPSMPSGAASSSTYHY